MLPESVSDLYNLQTLSVRLCTYLRELPTGIGNLINLRHLDNAYTSELKEMPHGIGKLTSLQTMPKFVVGKSSGLKLRELKDLKLLRGTLSISHLEHVMDIRDAYEANLQFKMGLDDLELVWSEDFDESRNAKLESDVLDNLQPNGNLVKLAIRNYGGLKFPSWIGDPPFSKVVEINLIGCERCTSLPPLGQLRLLKILCIGRMLELRSIGVEFYNEGHSSNFSFSSLESLTFDHMPKWEEWSYVCCTGEEVGVQFPRLQELTINKCPKLVRIPQFRLPSLCKLVLKKCRGVVLKSFAYVTSLITLRINSVAELSCVSRELMQFCMALETLELCKCGQLVSLWENEVTLQSLVRLKELVVMHCCKLVSLGEEEQGLPHNLEVLKIEECDNLENIPNGQSLRDLEIRGCKKLTSIAASLPPMLRRLNIRDCPALESLPNDEAGISNLEEFDIDSCSSLRWWAMGKPPNLASLKNLLIGRDCKNLETGMELLQQQQDIRMSVSSLENLVIADNNWGFIRRIVGSQQQEFTSLICLEIDQCDDIESFPENGWPVTPNLRSLLIMNCLNLKWLALNQIQRCLPSLQVMRIGYCPQLESFPDGDLPPNLLSLGIKQCGKGLKPLSEWGLHRLTSLRSFTIDCEYSDLVSFSTADDQIFPANLTSIEIGGFQNLKSLSSGLQNLTSLQCLSIQNCPKLRSLPKEDLLSKLSTLDIWGCPILKKRCKGHYWPLIAEIPHVTID